MTDLELLTPAEAGATLRLSEDTVRRRIADGKLRAVNVGTDNYPRLRVRSDDLAAYIEASTSEPLKKSGSNSREAAS